MSAIAANPICWVSFQLGGGWKRAGIAVGVYLAVLVSVTFFFQAQPNASAAQIASGWLTFLPFLMGLSLTVIGAGAIRKQIQRDFTSKMIESHRLTPMTGLTAAVGYTIGPNLVLLVFNLAVFASGLLLSPLAGKPVGDWLLICGVTLWLSLFVWCLSTFFALATAGAFSFLAIVVIGFLAGGVVFFLPGLAMLLGLYGFLSMQGPIPQVAIGDLTLPSLVLQATLMGLCLYGAARKFRGLHIRAFPTPVGLLLVLQLAVSGAFGILCTELTRKTGGPRNIYDEVPAWFQLGASMLAVNLAALTPVATAAYSVAAWRKRRRLEPEMKPRRPMGMLVASVLSVALIVAGFAGIFWMISHPLVGKEYRQQWIISAALLLAPLVSTGVIMQICYRVTDKARWPAVTWLAVGSLGPVILDGAYMASQLLPKFQFSWLTCVSPVGAMLMLWQGGHESEVQIGLTVQAVLAILLLGVMLGTGKTPAPAGEKG